MSRGGGLQSSLRGSPMVQAYVSQHFVLGYSQTPLRGESGDERLTARLSPIVASW